MQKGKFDKVNIYFKNKKKRRKKINKNGTKR
jgi:hypothetical protein